MKDKKEILRKGIKKTVKEKNKWKCGKYLKLSVILWY